MTTHHSSSSTYRATLTACDRSSYITLARAWAVGSRQAAGAMSGAGWTEEATKALLSIWGEGNTQLQLDRVASEMGYEFTSKQ